MHVICLKLIGLQYKMLAYTKPNDDYIIKMHKVILGLKPTSRVEAHCTHQSIDHYSNHT